MRIAAIDTSCIGCILYPIHGELNTRCIVLVEESAVNRNEADVVIDNLESSARATDSAKRRRTRAALIDAAFDVFSVHGLSGATVAQVTQAAGFTRGAFYSNFESKEELMLAVMDRERESATARMSGYIEHLADEDGDDDFSIDDLTETLMQVLTIGTAQRDWQLALMEALPVTMRDPVLAERQSEIRARAEADARLLVTQGLERLGRQPTIDTDLLVLVLLGVIERSLADALLQSRLDAFPRRAGSAIAAVLLHSSAPVES